MKNNIIYAILSLLVFLLSSCREDENNWLYLHVVNKSDTSICVFVYNTSHGEPISEYGDYCVLEPGESDEWMCKMSEHHLRQNSGVKAFFVSLPDCEHLDYSKLDTSIIEDTHEIKTIVKYYTVEELRAMDWTIVYDGNME